MIAYLAGGMHNNEWREFLKKELSSSYNLILDPTDWDCASPEEYTEKDLAAIRKSDYIVVYMDSSNPSGFGLSVEIGYAKALNKKIIFVDNIKDDYRSRYFGMHRVMATHVVKTLDRVVALLK
jgi:nucleoside 2-deoxyribosyltransferase